MPLRFSVPHTGPSPPLPSVAICCHLCFSQFVRVPSAHTHVFLTFLLAIASFAIDWRQFVANLIQFTQAHFVDEYNPTIEGETMPEIYSSDTYAVA